jgi:hypothetical protein
MEHDTLGFNEVSMHATQHYLVHVNVPYSVTRPRTLWLGPYCCAALLFKGGLNMGLVLGYSGRFSKRCGWLQCSRAGCLCHGHLAMGLAAVEGPQRSCCHIAPPNAQPQSEFVSSADRPHSTMPFRFLMTISSLFRLPLISYAFASQMGVKIEGRTNAL